MNLIIFENGTYEEEMALVDLDSGEVIMSGDHYHDKIEFKISGYLRALSDHNIYGGTPKEIITPEHEWFKKLRFYDCDED